MGRLKRRAVVVTVAVILAVTVAAWQAAPWRTGGVLAVVTMLVILSTRRRLASRRFDRQHRHPAVDALSTAAGAPVSLRINAAMQQQIPRQIRASGRLTSATRSWLSTRRPVQAAGRIRARAARPAATAAAAVQRHRAGPAITAVFGAPHLSDSVRGHIHNVVRDKLGLDLSVRWDLRGATVTGVWTPRVTPPSRVSVDKLEAFLSTAPEHRVYLGQGAGGAVSVDMDADSPHLGLSGATGGGKSVLVTSVAAQVLRHGGRVVVLDPKTSSHPWMVGLDRVQYCTQPADMHDALLAAEAEVDRRNRDADNDEHRVLIVVEELNSAVARLRAHWDDHRPRGGTRTSPALRALETITHQGRSARVHVLAAAQRLDARAIGGGAVRENFGTRLLARHTVNAWSMLASDVPRPAPSRVPGRWHLVSAGSVEELQVPFLAGRDARRISGMSPVSPVSPARGVAPVRRDVPGDSAPTGDSTPALVTLGEAVRQGILTGNREAIKKRWQRSTDRPSPVRVDGQKHYYRPEDLAAWQG